MLAALGCAQVSTRLDHLFHPYRPLEQKIQAISSNHNGLSEDDFQTLSQGAVLCNRWLFAPQGVKTRLQNLPIDKVNEVVERILTPALERDVSKQLKQFLRVLRQQQVRELASLSTDRQLQITLNVKAELKNDALQSFISKRGKVLWKEIILEIKNFFYYGLETAIATTGIDELHPDRGNRWGDAGFMRATEAQMRLKMYLDFLLYPATVFGIILTYVKNAATAVAATAAIFTGAIAFIGIYKRYFRPCPTECWGFQNMNLKKTQTEQEPIYARLDLLRKIDQAFQANKGVILIGEPGAGKTSIVQAYVQRVREGKSYQLSQNLQFFEGSASTIKEMCGFLSLERRFSFWPKGVAFCLKECHALFEKSGIAGEQIAALTAFQDSFRYLIGDTTTDSYNKYIKDNIPVRRRFLIIEVAKMLDEEVKNALYFYLHAKFPALDIDRGVIEEVYTRGPEFKVETSIIDSSTALLSRAIHKVTDLNFEDLHQEAAKLETDLNAIKHQLQHHSEPSEEELDRLLKAEKALSDKMQQIAEQKIALAKIQKVEKIYVALKEKSFKLAPHALSPRDRNNSLKKRDFIDGKALRAWLENEALMKQYDRFIRAERKKLGLASSVSVELIQKIVQEEGEAPKKNGSIKSS